METEEITKLVDGIYKNILDKFNPAARHMINAGKAYLKALHGAAAASKLYVDAITKLAKQAQQGTWGGSSDIGSALMQVVEVYREIQAQQMTILKAFYVDLLVPLETNLEKDTKVVQSEQKKFLQQHKVRSEGFSRAAQNMKKQRKKGTKGAKAGVALDKELKNMQLLEEEKSKLDVFCEQSLKTAITQERRRYGFVLERHCSLAKHYLAYHTAGNIAYSRSIEEWQEIAKSREYLPENVEIMFTTKLRAVSFWRDDELEDDRISLASQLRKTKSMDASCLDIRSINDAPSRMKPLSRAKSEFNLNSSSLSLANEEVTSPHPRPKSMAVPDKSTWDSPLARAVYPYLSSGDNQLSFLEGDVIALMGERTKGWQFGENLRTQCTGWFPLAYTEMIADDSSICSPTPRRVDSSSSTATTPAYTPSTTSGKPSPTTMFGDTLAHRRAVSQTHPRVGHFTCSNAGPPPSTTAPTPAGGTLGALGGKRAPPLPPLPPLPLHLAGRRGGNKPGSLHSSNDSGFSNDPPPQPEADYSDDENTRKLSPQPHGKEVVSSVRGWLLYKSALDLWEDVTTPDGQRPTEVAKIPHHATISRAKSAPKGTLGRYNSQDLLMSTPVAIEPRPVKRTKSLWRFRNKKSDVLEGMSLWRHRSLIDVNEHEENKTKEAIEESTEENEKENIYSSAESIKTIEAESVIVVEDHVTKDNFLPRTKLVKSLSSGTNPKNKEFKTWNVARATRESKWKKEENGNKCGPWYDLWGTDASVKGGRVTGT